MQKIAKDIYIETAFRGVTVGAIIGPEGVLCIDAPTYPADAQRWRQKLAQVTDKPIQFIVNLDYHRDRILGNHWLEAPIISHEFTSERVRMLPEVFRGGPSEAGADADLATDLAGTRIIAPQLTFSDRLTLRQGKREIHLVHRPGSSPGAVWVEVPEAEVVFVGDAVTNDVPPLMQECDINKWILALTELQKKKYPASIVVPGRGERTLDKAGVKTMDDFLRLARRKIEGMIRAKKTRTEVAALVDGLLEDNFTLLSHVRDHYARRLRTGLEHVYDSLLTGK